MLPRRPMVVAGQGFKRHSERQDGFHADRGVSCHCALTSLRIAPNFLYSADEPPKMKSLASRCDTIPMVSAGSAATRDQGSDDHPGR
jgi:hypothetical protein